MGQPTKKWLTAKSNVTIKKQPSELQKSMAQMRKSVDSHTLPKRGARFWNY